MSLLEAIENSAFVNDFPHQSSDSVTLGQKDALAYSCTRKLISPDGIPPPPDEDEKYIEPS
jgi:hypothetical protein